MDENQKSPTKRPAGTLELAEDEAYVLVKAAPRHSDSFGETVCCAGIDRYGHWVRLYPVSFRQLDGAQKFRRWDHIKFRWSSPKASKDTRVESRRVDHQSIQIIGSLRQADRNPLIARIAVTSLAREFEAKRSLAMLKAEVLDFRAVRRSASEIAESQRTKDRLRAQPDLFGARALIPTRTCPFKFEYIYRDEDGEHTGTCQDWETEQTFFKRLLDEASEEAALEWTMRKFGEEYPRRGMALAMGTHRYRLDQWLINGVIRLNDDPQMNLL